MFLMTAYIDNMNTASRLLVRIFVFLSCLTATAGLLRAERMIVPVDNGPLGNSITALLQDGDGFIWVGTASGLMRYDMHSYRCFDGTPVSRTMIRCLTLDDDGNIWAGTENGAVVWSSESERFRNIGGRIASHPVKTVTRTSQGTMLLTAGEGVAVVDPASLKVRFIAGEGEKTWLNNILTTTTDADGNIWAWSHDRLIRFDFTDDSMSPEIDVWPFAYKVRAMATDSLGRLWFNDRQQLMMMPLPSGDTAGSPVTIATGCDIRDILIADDCVLVVSAYDGIQRFHIGKDGIPDDKGITWIAPGFPGDVANSVQCVEKDRDGNYWFGTGDGIYVECERPKELFHNIAAGTSGGLIHNVVADISIGPDGALWAATSGGLECIRKVSPGSYDVEHFYPTPPRTENEEPGDIRLQTLAFDNDGTMWLGTKRTMQFFDPKQRRFFERRDITDMLAASGAQFSKELYRDSLGNMWMGFTYGGLFVYDAGEEKCRAVRFEGTELYDAGPQAILQDAGDYMWIGTKYKGILRFRPDDIVSVGDMLSVSHYNSYFRHGETSDEGISINVFHITADGTLLAGTSQGLYRYDARTDSFKPCTSEAPGKNVWILDIIADADGVLWISTEQGVYRYTPDSAQIPFHELYDGTFGRPDYNFGSCRDTAGTIYLGGINGITYFNPRQITDSCKKAKVYVSGISILNRQTVPDGIHLESDINRSRHLTLRHGDSYFSIDFTTLTFDPEGRERFYYRIEDSSSDWIPIAGTNRLSFSNLAQGEYLLQVKAADASGISEDGSAEIVLTVLPPWWLTWWAYCIYGLVVVSIGAAALFVIQTRLRAEQKVRMLKYKQQLFADLTHGLKTPLAMMQIPLQLLTDRRKSPDEESRQKLLAMLNTNVMKLSDIIRQLMEFRKIDQNCVSLDIADIDIVEYVRRICDCFRMHFELKGLDFGCRLPEEPIKMTLDPGKIELALYNLLQNASTFTLPGGSVDVSLTKTGNMVSIAVRDTGIGIRAENLDKIFQRFYQVHENNAKPVFGAGIGLTVAKEFVEMHNGRIKVESRYGAGSTFTICLPIKTLYRSEYYIVRRSEHEDGSMILPVYSKQYVTAIPYMKQEQEIDESKSVTVYILTGRAEISDIVRMVLSDCNVAHFGTATAASEAIKKRRPQLILIDTDVYDRSESLDFCRKIKDMKQTEDIPVVLLASDSTPEDTRQFIDAGADSWMEMPFDVDLFQARIHQLARRYVDLQQKLKIGQIIGGNEEIVVETADEKFMNRVAEVVEKNISNEDFTLEVFAKEAGVSRTVLNMRIQGIVRQSPMELLRNARMHRAAKLLETDAYDVAQVGYMVGFSDPRYFSTCFKKQFGETPRAYRQNHRKS